MPGNLSSQATPSSGFYRCEISENFALSCKRPGRVLATTAAFSHRHDPQRLYRCQMCRERLSPSRSTKSEGRECIRALNESRRVVSADTSSTHVWAITRCRYGLLRCVKLWLFLSHMHAGRGVEMRRSCLQTVGSSMEELGVLLLRPPISTINVWYQRGDLLLWMGVPRLPLQLVSAV